MRRDGMWVKQIMGRQGIPCAVGMAFFIAKFINFDFGITNDNILWARAIYIYIYNQIGYV